MIWKLVGLVLLLALSYVGYLYVKTRRIFASFPVKGIPGAAPSFPFGNLPDLQDKDGNVLAGTNNYVDKWKDPVTGMAVLWLGPEPIVIVTRPDHLKTVFQSVFRKTIPNLQKHHNVLFGRRSLTGLMNDEWSFHRKTISKALDFTRLQEMVKELCVILENASSILTKKHALLCQSAEIDAKQKQQQLPAHLQPYGSKGLKVNVLDIARRISMDTIGMVAFGFDFRNVLQMADLNPPEFFDEETSTSVSDGEMTKVAKAFELMLHELSTRIYSINPLDALYFLPTERNRNVKTARETIRGVIRSMIKERRDHPENDHEDFLHNVLRLNSEASDPAKTMTDEDLEDEILTLLFAGYDTTAITVSYALYLLAKNPEKRRLLEAEIDRVLPPNPETGELPLPSYADISRLKFTLRVAKESLRLFPPAPLTTRTSTEPVELDAEPEGGEEVNSSEGRKTLQFPAGTSFWVPIWHIHHQDKYWPEAEAFQPERFLTEEEREQLELAAQRPIGGPSSDLSASLNTRQRKPSSHSDLHNEPISRSGSALPFEPTTSSSAKKSGSNSSSSSSSSSSGLANANSMYKFLPFAQGPRNCVGYRFAQLEATVMIACLCQRLRFELEDPEWNVTAFYYGVLQNPKHHVIPMLVYPRH